jgi:hypothetical protein
MNRVVQTKTLTAMIHMGMREPFVLDSDGTRYVLPADASRRSGQTVAVLANPSTLTATIKAA